MYGGCFFDERGCLLESERIWAGGDQVYLLDLGDWGNERVFTVDLSKKALI